MLFFPDFLKRTLVAATDEATPTTAPGPLSLTTLSLLVFGNPQEERQHMPLDTSRTDVLNQRKASQSVQHSAGQKEQDAIAGAKPRRVESPQAAWFAFLLLSEFIE